MATFKHLLVATDFGAPANHAEDFALGLAEKFGARVTILFVFSAPSAAYATATFEQLDELQREAARTLEAHTNEIKKRLPRVEGVFRVGNVWETILAVAREIGADLIAMGTAGRRGLPRAVLGSVAERVVRMANVPVLTVAAAEDERPEAANAART